MMTKSIEPAAYRRRRDTDQPAPGAPLPPPSACSACPRRADHQYECRLGRPEWTPRSADGAYAPRVCIAVDDDGEAHALRDPAGNGQTLVIVATPTSASPVYVPTTPLVPTKATSALLRPIQPQMPPQGGAIVFGAEQPAALQHRHNLLHKVLNAIRQQRRHQVKPSAPSLTNQCAI